MGNSPTSVAVVPSEPAGQTVYPISALGLYRVYPDRATYQAAFGQQPKPFDPSKSAKYWFATDTSDPAVFEVYDPNARTLTKLTMPAADAAAVNIPGAYKWPVYNPPKTIASYQFFGTTTQITGQCARMADVQVLLATIPSATATPATGPSGQPVSYSDTDGQLYMVTLPDGNQKEAGPMIQQMYFGGIGHPGHWDASWLTWNADQDITTPQPGILSVLGPPLRPLAADETLMPSIFNAYIQRGAAPSPSPAGGSFTDVDRAMLTDTHVMLQKVIKAMSLG